MFALTWIITAICFSRAFYNGKEMIKNDNSDKRFKALINMILYIIIGFLLTMFSKTL